MMGTKISNKVQDENHLELIVNIKQWVITFVHISCANFFTYCCLYLVIGAWKLRLSSLKMSIFFLILTKMLRNNHSNIKSHLAYNISYKMRLKFNIGMILVLLTPTI